MKINNVILQTGAQISFFIIILFSVYIFFAGHNTPGGGFVGGLLTTGGIVLLLLAYDVKTVRNILPINFMIIVAFGLLLSLGMASGSLIFDVPFFTHSFGTFYLPILGETMLHTALIFDLGVYFVVVGAAMTIIQTMGGDS